METTEVKHIKGAVHTLLAIAPLLEIKHSSSKFRNVLLGLAAGWHLNAAFFHFFLEGENEKSVRKTKSTKNKPRKTKP